MKETLVGAGPGDIGLLTLTGAERIKNADVVLYDRFVGDGILALIPGTAEKIDVGKYAGNHPVPQDEINRLLLDRALRGLEVVRLKGGDPFVFGRGGEELELLAEHGVPFEVVPGVTSAVAGPAYAGIPVTHRDYASSFHVMTGHAKNNEPVNIDFDALVRLGGTLVFMMGVAAVGDICAGCLAAGMDAGVPAAIVENATTGDQRKFVGTVGTLASIARENDVKSPSVIIVGKVCRLSERYDWFGRKPLSGKRVYVARVKPGASKLSDRLRELGCVVTESAPAEIIPLTDPGCSLEKALGALNEYAWLVFTSASGVNVFFDYLTDIKFDLRRLNRLKVACVGAATEKEVNMRGIYAEYRPEEYGGEALARGLIDKVKKGEKILIARAKDGAADLTRILAEAGVSYFDAAIYDKIYGAVNATEYNAEYAAFTSSKAVEYFAEAAAGMDFSGIKAVCIGERTAGAARSYGMETYVSAEATVDSLADRIAGLLK
jgi:uroporphyrinogen III methyltransferase/synthase